MIKNVCDHCDDGNSIVTLTMRIAEKRASVTGVIDFKGIEELDLCLLCLKDTWINVQNRTGPGLGHTVQITFGRRE